METLYGMPEYPIGETDIIGLSLFMLEKQIEEYTNMTKEKYDEARKLSIDTMEKMNASIREGLEIES